MHFAVENVPMQWRLREVGLKKNEVLSIRYLASVLFLVSELLQEKRKTALRVSFCFSTGQLLGIHLENSSTVLDYHNSTSP